MFSWVLRLSFLSIHLITHIEHNAGFQVVKNVRGSSRVINCAKLTIFSTLNDEGDFLIAGINDNNHDETPSLSLEGNLQFSSQFSGEVSEALQQQNKGSILGLDDYGDFPLNIPSAEEEGTFYSLGTQSMMAARNNNSNEVSILPTTTRVKEKRIIMDNIESSGNKDSKMEEFESSEMEIEALEGFLTSFFSTLNPKVLRTYAKGLERLGFDPDCDSSKELEFEDLRFMKNLHQRYFWKEWEKLTKNVE